MQQMRTTSDLEVARIMERRPQPHVYRNHLPSPLPPPVSPPVASTAKGEGCHLTIRNPYFMTAASHPGCSCPYLKNENHWHSLEQCSCPHEDLHAHFETKNIENIVAMLPSRETDILDDLVDSSSSSEASDVSEVSPRHIVTLHRASALPNKFTSQRQISDEDEPISTLISKSGWLGDFEEQKKSLQLISTSTANGAMNRLRPSEEAFHRRISEGPVKVEKPVDGTNFLTTFPQTESEPCFKVGRKEYVVNDEKCAGNMGSLTESRASSVTTEKMGGKERNREEESIQSGTSSVGDSGKVEIEKENRGEEEEEEEEEEDDDEGEEEEEEEDEMTPDEAFNLATADSSSEDFLQTGALVVEEDTPPPPPPSASPPSLVISPAHTSTSPQASMAKKEDEEGEEESKGQVKAKDEAAEGSGSQSPPPQIDRHMRASAAKSFYQSIDSAPERRWSKRTLPLVSDLVLQTMSAQKRTASVLPASIGQSTTLSGADLKLLVYRKTLNALAYPISGNTPHNFEVFNATSPTYCYECEGLLWGVARQGLRCSECGVKCHEKCKRLLNADCLQRSAEKSSRHGAEDKAQAAMNSMRSLIHRRLADRPDIFRAIFDIFAIDPVEGRARAERLAEVERSILSGASQWSAKLAITVKSAQGLIGKDKSGRSDPYVTVQVGKVRRRTKTVPQELNPTWDEKFWLDEDNDLKSKIRQKFTRESDDFLGQAIIEVRTLGGEMDLWYNLEKRTDKSAVSGAIRLNISIEIKGEENSAPYHIQYTCLHEEELWRVFFDPLGQEISDEFAMRYGIESIFQAMTHFACLTTKYNCVGVPAQLSTLLANINAFYAHTSSNNSQTASERFAASNFGREKFVKILDNLHNALRIDLSKYRTIFPASQPERLADMKCTVDVLTSITFFRLKVQELAAPPRTLQVLRECIRACMKATYECLSDNVQALYGGNFQACREKSSAESQSDIDPVLGVRSLSYWHKLISLMVSVIEDDRKHYAPVLNQFPQDINLGDLSAEMMWNLLAEDISVGLTQHYEATGEQITTTRLSKAKIKTSDYLNLCFRIKWFYNTYVRPSRWNRKEDDPEYPKWFEPLVMLWLSENDEVSENYLRNAYERDKRDGFQRSSEHALYSNSVVDVFTQLNQCFDVIRKLECPDRDVEANYMHRFAQTVEKVLLAYSESVQLDFAQFKSDARTACILINNTQQLRVQLEKVYEAMEGEDFNLHEETREQLTKLQVRLKNAVDLLVFAFAGEFEEDIQRSVLEMGRLLQGCKETTSGGGSAEGMEADCENCLRPLMDYFELVLSAQASLCEKTVLKRLLKELWRITMENTEKLVVLPGVSDTKQDFAGESLVGSRDLTPYQCEVLTNCLDTVQVYFHAGGRGLKRSFLQRSPELHNLQQALALYSQTTDTLLKDYVTTEIFIMDMISPDDACGYLNVQVEVFKHPGTGEYKAIVKGKDSSYHGVMVSGLFRPFVEVYLFGPLLTDCKRRFTTKSKSGTISPLFNETFVYYLSSRSDPEWYELQFVVKDYCFGRSDRLVASSLLTLSQALDLGGSAPVRLPLTRRQTQSEAGWTVLRILSQRLATDEVAREFVRVKTECCSAAGTSTFIQAE
ncbi:Protein unc-13 B [Echinococcus granulosus]|uniref:Protein unc-13 B n=1 Tax=Echinococcus granulosus TaxID=6210 RepID=W6UAK7_ECHGR|nr:Protein unc-13 B [Echinococcus granulosus]EUB55477.1 Protein unc-13 B [Echinococcus granulosus]